MMLILLCLMFGFYSNTIDCQRKIHFMSENPCDENPCLYGGSCHHVNDSIAYLCHCSGGRWGRHCEFAGGLQPCGRHECQSGSMCKPDADQKDHYECICRSGQSGRYCNVTATEVVETMACEKKCGERGVAVISRKKNRSCTCRCHKKLYDKINSTDKLCLKPLACAPKNRTNPLTGKWEQKMPCENGGSCELSRLTGYYCKCQQFYTGKHCENYDDTYSSRNPCLPHPCWQGVCLLVMDQSASKPDKTPKAYCFCPPGFKGENCQKKITACDLFTFEEECNAALREKCIDPHCGKANQAASKCPNGGICEPYSFAKNGFRCRNQDVNLDGSTRNLLDSIAGVSVIAGNKYILWTIATVLFLLLAILIVLAIKFSLIDKTTITNDALALIDQLNASKDEFATAEWNDISIQIAHLNLLLNNPILRSKDESYNELAEKCRVLRQ